MTARRPTRGPGPPGGPGFAPRDPRTLVACALFAALIAAGGYLRIPGPVVPLTLQAPVALLGGMLLGPRRGAGAAAVYAALGLMGLPVFAAGGGLQYLVHPTFGFILGFILGAWLAGTVAGAHPRPTVRRCAMAALAGTGAVYAAGAGYYLALTALAAPDPRAGWAVLPGMLLPPLPGDVLACGVCALLTRRLRPRLPAGWREE